MADQTTQKEDKTQTTASSAATDARVNGPETTTTNDTALAINQPIAPADDQKVDTEDSKREDIEDSLIQTPGAATPVVVSDADVAAVEKENDPHASLAEQIEVLTGEVQALRSKIERLTSGVVQTPPAPPISPSNSSQAKSSSPSPAPKSASDDQPPPVAEKSVPLSTHPSVALSASPSKSSLNVPPPPATAPVNDIYAKILNPPEEGRAKHKDLNDDATLSEESSGIGTIGEVLIIFGFVALLLLAASPFVRANIGTNWDALKSIGWPTATISLGLGSLLFLFNRGRVLLKVFGFLLLFVAGLMTAAVFDYGSTLGPLSGLLDPIASFYR